MTFPAPTPNATAVADDNQLMIERREKLQAIRAAGVAFPNDFKPTHHAADLQLRHGNAANEELEPQAIQVAVAGRLRWREWETQDGQKRQAVSIVADNVQFIGPRDGGDFAAGQRNARQGGHDTPPGDMGGTPPGDFDEPDDDIPF